MASANYETGRAIRAMRAALTVRAVSGTERWRGALHAAAPEAPAAGTGKRERRALGGARPEPNAFLRGVLASIVIASGYVAVMAGAHWLLGGFLR